MELITLILNSKNIRIDPIPKKISRKYLVKTFVLIFETIIDNLFDIEDLGEDLESIEDVEDTMSVIRNCVDSLQITNKGELNKLMQDLYNEALTVETV